MPVELRPGNDPEAKLTAGLGISISLFGNNGGITGGITLDKKNTDLLEPIEGISNLYQAAETLLEQISNVVLGKQEVVKLCLTALFAGEHILLEDVPGVGKTLLGKAMARAVVGDFSRIQFTPDLLPSDITGSSVYNSKTNEFVFNKGPIFSNFVLADEINRAPPRTQSALLEVMSDTQVSADGHTWTLPPPFMVIATQNPYEFEGTYALPESQLDRFLMRLSVGYPDRQFEADILTNHRQGDPVDRMAPVCAPGTISNIQTSVREVKVDPSISTYMMDVVNHTRSSDIFNVGVSTRGALAWYRAVQAVAFLDRRDFAIPDDAKDLATKVLSHRVQLSESGSHARKAEMEAALINVINQVPLPS